MTVFSSLSKRCLGNHFFKNSGLTKRTTLPVFLVAAVVLGYSVPSQAVRFQMEDDFSTGGARTAYPEAVRPVTERTGEVMAFISQAPLAASFQYLALVDAVKAPKEGASAMNYLALSAETLITQAPEALQADLRAMYFEGKGIEITNETFRRGPGRSFFTTVVGRNSFHVSMIEGLEKTPILEKALRALAIVDIATQAAALEQGHDARLFFPVSDMVSKMSQAWFVEETIANLGLKAILEDAKKYEGVESIRQSLAELFGAKQMDERLMDWTIANRGLKDEQLKEWMLETRIKRGIKSAAIRGLSSVDNKMDEIVRRQVSNELAEEPGNQFLMMRKARERGDFRQARILRSKVTVIVGGVSSCGISFIPQ